MSLKLGERAWAVVDENNQIVSWEEGYAISTTKRGAIDEARCNHRCRAGRMGLNLPEEWRVIPIVITEVTS